MIQAGMKQQLLTWFKSMTAKYSWLSFRYEYSKKLGTFIVGFYPSDKVDSSDEFCLDAITFEDKMSDLYGDDAPLFGNEEECFRFSIKASTYIKPIKTVKAQISYDYSASIEFHFGNLRYTDYEYEGYAIENIAA